jgi:CRP/FNR family transcriptional regulator, cyclic AMP receptor protein
MSKTDTHPFWHNIFRQPEDTSVEITKLWMASPLLNDIPERICQGLVRTMHRRHYSPGELIFQVGDHGAGAAMIREGEVSIRSGEHELTRLSRGDLFGETALVADELRTADAVATTDTELVFFLQTDLMEWIDHDPKHGARWVINLARVLAARLLQCNKLIGKEPSRVV